MSTTKTIVSYTTELTSQLLKYGKKQTADRYVTAINSLRRYLRGKDLSSSHNALQSEIFSCQENVFVKREQRKLACSAERRKGRMKSKGYY